MSQVSMLPTYVQVRENGVFILVSPPPAQDILRLFVDRLFKNDAYFKDLDYALFLDLLYGTKPVTAKNGLPTEVRLASEIAIFAPHRKSLYRIAKITPRGFAQYLFEPVFTEVTFETPVLGTSGDGGISSIVEVTQKTELRRTKLDFDEFVAAMWCHGVTFGIDADAVRTVIQSGVATLIEIAYQREPTDSRDAQIVEEKSDLRQDRSPLINANGKASLNAAKNYFPQVIKNIPLLRKIPCALGDPGYRVTGATIEPRAPKDIDLRAMSGPGTRLEPGAQGDTIVADMDGFLRFDERSKKVEVTATIENRSGISTKSTGDIKLDVDNFVEHGEVQEGRIVKGKHMTFRSAVYGTIHSSDGNICIDDNLSGGNAKSNGGNVSIHGRAINASIEAWDGNITVNYAESCVIFGKSASIKHAVNCDIVAETLRVGVVEGCAIVGNMIDLSSTLARKDKETIVTVLLPNHSTLESQIIAAKENIIKIDAVLQRNAVEMAAARADPKLAKFIELGDKIREGKIELTTQQHSEWQKIFARFPPAVKDSLALMGKRKSLLDTITDLSQQIETSLSKLYCNIKEVLGETAVQTLRTPLDLRGFQNLSRSELKISLQNMGAPNKKIFSGCQGQLKWQYKA
ncbi:MAG: FapA family protein [Candidatus Nitrotoga sp.]|nr:FapA family protein [Candidatus Nitrotoga sp.]MDO9447813.1 FapA family protein [Candidatus Nitrotoga sp.]MDP1637215.1 FapA family protein [Candidatus Nitrotoga sp.]MDP1854711.1 FapA family protein [Candidatus Nitrotoga sp.]MDP3498463.1 FapA family protein [Candidatus Nitrotoga sp.]